MAAKLDAIERSDDNNDEPVERGSADRVFERLKRRPHRKRDVDNTELGCCVQQQWQRMKQCEAQSSITGPAVDAKNIEAAMRPVADRTVASENHQADENIRRGKTDGERSRVSRYIERRHAERLWLSPKFRPTRGCSTKDIGSQTRFRAQRFHVAATEVRKRILVYRLEITANSFLASGAEAP